MIKYLIILLDRTSASFCHYSEPNDDRKLIGKDTLRKAIRYAMLHNLAVQVVYPHYEVPDEIKAEIEKVDTCRIMSIDIADGSADVVVVNGWNFEKVKLLQKPTTVRVSKDELFCRYEELMPLMECVPNVNVVITDIEDFGEKDFKKYAEILGVLRQQLENDFMQAQHPSINLLTDRLMLKQMNNCGAGCESITLSPEGKFYVCPAFYYENPEESVGNIEDGKIEIVNSYLYAIGGAPICRHCDAWHCKRCVWLNRKTTREVNTPSHEQCVVAHLEREASRQLLEALNDKGDFAFESPIEKLDYLDPFDNRQSW